MTGMASAASRGRARLLLLVAAVTVTASAAAILAFIPLTHSALWGPMAIALIGGLIVATMLTVTFLPALCAAFFKAARPATPLNT